MYFSDLQKYLAHLETVGDLVRIRAEVDPYLETAAIIDRTCKSEHNNKALLFEDVKDSKIPLVANLFGTTQRTAKALGVDNVEQLADQLRNDLAPFKGLTSDKALAKVISKDIAEPTESSIRCSEHIDCTAAGLDALPALHSWPGDAGRYLTLAQVFTRDPTSDSQNCGMYRVQVTGRKTALARFHPGSGAGQHMQEWHRCGEAMPVTLVLGGPPMLTCLAATPLPEIVDETDFCSYLSNAPLALSCSSSGLKVPTQAEIIIDGFITPGETRIEGPFGNHTGKYTAPAPAPVINMVRLVRKENVVYPCTVVGPPPMENLHIAAAIERLLLPLLQHDHPWVTDIHMPCETIFHRAAIVAIEDNCSLTAKEISQSLWTSALLKGARIIVLLRPDMMTQDLRSVYWQTFNAGRWVELTHMEQDKLVIDIREDSDVRKVRADEDVLRLISTRWAEYGLCN
jgi:4-hydroxy-3-polyprenylbenzoate decarboxylase